MTYKFTEENNTDLRDLTIVDPTIDIVDLSIGNPKISNINFQTNKYSIEIRLLTDSTTYGMLLNNVQAESMDMASQGADIPMQVLTALNEQFAIDEE